jgi:hypothetical protein
MLLCTIRAAQVSWPAGDASIPGHELGVSESSGQSSGESSGQSSGESLGPESGLESILRKARLVSDSSSRQVPDMYPASIRHEPVKG